MKTVKVSGSCLKHEGSFLKSVACFCSEKPALGYFTFSQYLSEAKASLHIVAIFSSENFYLRELLLINLSSCFKYNSGSSSLHQATEMLSFPICFSSGGACIRKLVGKNQLSVPVRCQRPSTNLHTNICNNKINTVLHGFFFFFDRWTAMACYLSLPPIKMHIGSALACHLPLLGKVGCGPRFRWAGFFFLAIVPLISAL